VRGDRLAAQPDAAVITLEPKRDGDRGIRIDLSKIDSVQAPEASVLGRYVNMIQMARGDFNGKILTVRGDDVRALAAVLDTTPDVLSARLEELGLRAHQFA